MNAFRKKAVIGGTLHTPTDADDQEESEIRVDGYHMSVTWWQRRLIVQYHKHWQGAVEITSDACVRAEYMLRELPGYSEWVLSIRLQAGNPSELQGALEIAFPLDREKALQLLVMRISAEISTRKEKLARSSGELLAQVPVLPKVVVPPPQPQERERPSEPPKREPSSERGMGEARTSPVVELAPPRTAPSTSEPQRRDEQSRAPTVVPPQALDPEPRVRDEPPRLRQLTFLQAPDNDEWITFCPLRTAEDVRAPVREHG